MKFFSFLTVHLNYTIIMLGVLTIHPHLHGAIQVQLQQIVLFHKFYEMWHKIKKIATVLRQY